MKGIMKYSRTIMLLEAVIIAVLATLLILEFIERPSRSNDQPNLITHFDQMDLDRIKEMIQRFEDGKGDNLTLLNWGIDSGPFIHDVYNDGRELRWTLDNTRDSMSSATGKTEYVCKAIGLENTTDFYRVNLSEYSGYPKEEKINIIFFRKDEL
ncbi:MULTISPECIES: DUF4362 domain-containing protein [Paenibacillus]|uniref:Uncharacterized protein n=1 Tax=Paenibacillus borealis TaxID=160799 RepID=A0ABX3H1P5_PAEBO|nr:DUF4362 domain-containing protein [Paenibacillus borealis]OMD43824.1 hypothetical protein BSK56_23745 [Paenibacillus borealis]